MFGLFKSVADLTGSVIDIVKAPVEVALDVTKAVVKPVADIANEIVDEIKEITK